MWGMEMAWFNMHDGFLGTWEGLNVVWESARVEALPCAILSPWASTMYFITFYMFSRFYYLEIHPNPYQSECLLLLFFRGKSPPPHSRRPLGTPRPPPPTPLRRLPPAEGIVRGHKGGLLTASEYNNLAQCENLEDIKMNLTATDYGPYLQVSST